MQKFQEKRDRRKLIYSQLSIVILLLLIALLSHAVWNIYQKKLLTDTSRATAERELEQLRARQSSLQADLARLTSKTGREAELRSKFQVSKPGEEVIVLVGASSSASVAPALSSKKSSLWQMVRQLF
jgi:cell division protein FtsB